MPFLFGRRGVLLISFMSNNEQSGNPWRGVRSDGKRWRGVSAELRGRTKDLRENLTEAESLLWE